MIHNNQPPLQVSYLWLCATTLRDTTDILITNCFWHIIAGNMVRFDQTFSEKFRDMTPKQLENHKA